MKDPLEDHKKAGDIAIKITKMLEADNTPPYMSSLALIQALAAGISAASLGDKARTQEGMDMTFLLLQFYVMGMGKAIDELFKGTPDKPN